MWQSIIAERALLHISSSAFENEGVIPRKYTCDGAGINPPVKIEHVPEGTKSFVVLMDDPDAPGKVFDHWVVWNILPNQQIKENSTPGSIGKNSLGKNEYIGPCPPSGEHRYFIKVYALDTLLDLDDTADKNRVETALEQHILAYGELVGVYQKETKKH
ncbi:MAG TPA: YbhB/YbcL family Raf kinase inhibitor-like protein [Ohtaekwangia sp.]|nr:YbhB/YbcL family Raf kinase inhibitor-like protein [Ohtaekwangia sp.]